MIDHKHSINIEELLGRFLPQVADAEKRNEQGWRAKVTLDLADAHALLTLVNQLQAMLEPKRVCAVCEHEACPYCLDWCDSFVPDEYGEDSMCCDGVCTYVDEAEEAP